MFGGIVPAVFGGKMKYDVTVDLVDLIALFNYDT